MMERLGVPQRVYSALHDAFDFIARCAESFDIVWEETGLRMMKTRPLLLKKGGPLEEVKVFFRIIDDSTVEMVYIVREDSEA
ncbi:MAG TPA: hypothetical protein VG796_30225 [Verrucomicrobiales bacterium]|nr:hypothetical protein [Verrucomicrobiales bacterium]